MACQNFHMQPKFSSKLTISLFNLLIMNMKISSTIYIYFYLYMYFPDLKRHFSHLFLDKYGSGSRNAGGLVPNQVNLISTKTKNQHDTGWITQNIG